MKGSHGFIPYDPVAHGVLHTPDWHFHHRLGEADIYTVEHLKLQLFFFPTPYQDDAGVLRFGTTWQGPDDAPDDSTILNLAQHAMRFYCHHLKTNPETEIADYIARSPIK